MGTHRSYIWCHQEPTRPTGTRQGIHDATSQWMCCGKWSALWTSYVILKRVPANERKSMSQNLFIFGPMLIGTFLLILGWGIPRKSLWHRFWNTLYKESKQDCSMSISLYSMAHEKPARRLVDQRGRRSWTLYRKLTFWSLTTYIYVVPQR